MIRPISGRVKRKQKKEWEKWKTRKPKHRVGVWNWHSCYPTLLRSLVPKHLISWSLQTLNRTPKSAMASIGFGRGNLNEKSKICWFRCTTRQYKIAAAEKEEGIISLPTLFLGKEGRRVLPIIVATPDQAISTIFTIRNASLSMQSVIVIRKSQWHSFVWVSQSRQKEGSRGFWRFEYSNISCRIT